MAANDNPPIFYLGIEQGLSNNSIRCIYQDHNGFMWFGTFDGLNRYDGYEFKTFRNKSKDSLSLVHNYINAIAEDKHQNLWIGTGQGIGIYNNLTSKFFPGFYYAHGTKKKEKIPFYINDIKTDTKGNVFIATNGGGFMMQPEGDSSAIQLPCIRGANGVCSTDAQCIVIDKKQRIWIFVAGIGICLYDQATKTIRVISEKLKAIRCMEADNKDNLWMGGYDGLYKFEISTGVLIRAYDMHPGRLTANSVLCLQLDGQGKMWIGTEGGGIDILDLTTGKFGYMLPGESKTSLSSESVLAIFEDGESREWIGTLKGGINIIDPQKNRFQTIAHVPFMANSLTSNFVSSFHEDSSKNLWIGSDGGGISIWDRSKNEFTNYHHIPNFPQSLSHNSVPSIQEDYLGDVWIATFGEGINKFNKKTGAFSHYKCINDQTGEENNYVWQLYEDRNRNLWAATYANGRLYRLNRSKDRFEVFINELVDFFSLAEDHDGTLWGGTAFGLVKIDKTNKTYIRHVITKPVRAIFEDSKRRLWIGTEGLGLILFNREKGSIEKGFTDKEGLCNNSILNIMEDGRGYLWLSTFNGLSEFNTVTKTFENYYQDDGLQSNQFMYNAALRLRSGELVFGGIKGFTLFQPDSMSARVYRPPVILTGLRIHNSEVVAGSPFITKITGDQIAALKIPYDEAVLSFDFAALEYSAPGKISYAYYLQNWDKDWNYTSKLRTANYTNLHEGKYTLRIKSTNAEGSWNPHEVRVNIVVRPPWYRSWWMYASYILLVLSGIVLYQRYRINQEKLAYDIKLARISAQKERAERETERVVNEKDREINEKRLSFFTNISHEFRTPLTLIINPLKDMLRSNALNDETKIRELDIVYRNARRLLSLVDQLLLFRKSEAGANKLRLVKLDFCRLSNDVYLAFIQQARVQKIEFMFECGSKDLEMYVDREKMEIILYNLLSNAFKYTPQGGRIILSLREMERHIEVVVEDSGSGIPHVIGDKLFERFYQVREKGVSTKPGFGIGLYLVKHFIESHHGEVSYESVVNKGTTFFVRLQKGKQHFGDQPVFDEKLEEPIPSKEWIAVEDIGTTNLPKEKISELEPLINENLSILLVDDDEQMLSYLSKIFSEKYTVHKANTGEEGVKAAFQHLPDIIISDIKMPGISGIDFCKTVKENPALSHIPVVLLTGESSQERKLEGVVGGADDYITKPFEKDFLVAKVANLLKNRNNLQNYFYNEITLQDNPLKISEEYKVFLEKCISMVEQNIDDEDFNVKKLAAELNISHSSLYKKVKSISGQSVNAFIRFIRLRKAAELLINTSSNVNEASSQVGFTSVKYFREQFSKLFGMKPSDYIKNYRKAFGKSYNFNDDGFKDDE